MSASRDVEEGKLIGEATCTEVRCKPDGSIEIVGDVDDDTRAEILGDFERMRRQQARRLELWGEDMHTASMARLCALFPTLRGVPGTDPWNALELLAWLTGPAPTGGSSWAALFVLGVWNPTTNWQEEAAALPMRKCGWCGGRGYVDREGDPARREAHNARKCERCDGAGKVKPSIRAPRFDVLGAMGTWDPQHVAAFVAWIEAPFWP